MRYVAVHRIQHPSLVLSVENQQEQAPGVGLCLYRSVVIHYVVDLFYQVLGLLQQLIVYLEFQHHKSLSTLVRTLDLLVNLELHTVLL
jgi:hypothetical protein